MSHNNSSKKSGIAILEKVGKNSFFAAITTIGTAVAGLLTSILLARYLGVEEYGKYSYLLWIVGIFAIFANFGLPNTVIKYVSEFNARSSELAQKFYRRIIGFEIGVSVICSLTIILWGIMKSEVSFFYLAAFLLIPQSIGRILSSVAHGLQKFEITAKIKLMVTPLQVGVLWLLLSSGRGVPEIVILLIVSEAIQCLFIRSAIDKLFHGDSITAKHEKVVWSKVFSFSSSIFFLTLLDAVVWQKSEVFFLKHFSSMEAVGIYSLGYGLTYMAMQVPITITNVIFPVFSEAYGVDAQDVLRRGYYYSIKYLSLMLLPSVTLMVIVIPQIVLILYGKEYVPAIAVMRILLVVSAVATIHRPISSTLYSTENQQYIIKITVFLACCNIALDFILIPTYGVIGAAFANGAVQVGSVVLGLIFIHNKFSYDYPVGALLKISAGSLIVAIPFLALTKITNGWFFLLISCLGYPILFCCCTYFIRPLTESTDRKIFAILEKKAPLRYRKAVSLIQRCFVSEKTRGNR